MRVSAVGTAMNFLAGTNYLHRYTRNNGADMTSAIQAAIADTPEGGTLIGPNYTLYSGAIEVDKRIRFILPQPLVRHASQTSITALVTISANKAVFSARSVDFDAFEDTGYATSNAFAVRVTGDEVIVYETEAKNTPFVGGGNCFDISGADCVLMDCEAINAGYAGFRTMDIATLDADNHPVGDAWLIRCTASNYRVKGYVTNRNTGTVHLIGFKASVNTDAAHASSDAILFDGGATYRTFKLIVDGAQIHDACLSNVMKVVNTRHVVVKNSRIFGSVDEVRTFRQQTETTGGLPYEDCDIVLEDTEFGHSTETQIFWQTEGERANVYAKRTTWTRPSTGATLEAVDFRGGVNILEDCSYDPGENAAPRFIGFPGSLIPSRAKVTLIRPRNLGTNTAYMFRLHTHRPAAGDWKVIDPIGSWLDTGTAAVDARIQRNEGYPRQFYAASSVTPAGAAWERGDQIIYSDASAAGNIGSVCTQSGTVGYPDDEALSSVTGSITDTESELTVNDADDLFPGMYITIVGVTGVFRILSKSGLVLTLDGAADATVSGADVAFSAPEFKTFGVIET